MLETLLTALIGFGGGAAIGAQSPIVVAMGARIGTASASFVMHLGGAIASLALVIFRGGELLHAWRTLPLHMLFVGVCGLLLFLSLAQTIPRFGVATAIGILVAGQVGAGLVIDHFGFFEVPKRPISNGSLIGFALVIAGVLLLLEPWKES